MSSSKVFCHIAAFSAFLSLSLISSGCKNHDKPSVPDAVRVDVEILDGDGNDTSSNCYSGTAEAADASSVSFAVPGTIEKIYVKVGDRVSKNQVLARVKSESLANARNIAQAELAEARDAYERLKKLHDANALPDIKWVEVQSKLSQAENAAAISERAVGDAILRSPINGYVADKIVSEGQTVIAAEPVMKLVGLGNMQAVISVPAEDVDAFAVGSKAEVRFDALDSVCVEGILSQKGVSADPLTRTFELKYDIANPGGKVLPGMICSVKPDVTMLEGKLASKVYMLPSQAVLLDADNRRFVWVVNDGRAARRFVSADELGSDGVLVSKGLASGDSVIVAGMQKVSTGTRVIAAK